MLAFFDIQGFGDEFTQTIDEFQRFSMQEIKSLLTNSLPVLGIS
jgi:hypothetical protein